MEIIITLIGQIVGVAIGSLIWAIMLRAAAKWVIKEDVPYGNAYLAVFLSSLITTVLAFIVGAVVALAFESEAAINIASVLMVPVSFFIYARIISWRLKTSFGKACLITLAMIAIGVAIALVLGAIAVLIMLAVR